MQRDWNILRELLEKFEDDTIESFLEELSPKTIESIDQEKNDQIVKSKLDMEDVVFGHLLLLLDLSMVDGIAVQMIGNQWAFSSKHPRLTAQGHDLLDSLRNKTIWDAVKNAAKKLGVPVSIELIKAVALKVVQNA